MPDVNTGLELSLVSPFLLGVIVGLGMAGILAIIVDRRSK